VIDAHARGDRLEAERRGFAGRNLREFRATTRSSTACKSMLCVSPASGALRNLNSTVSPDGRGSSVPEQPR
jgi:hypothetical protein